MPNAHPHRWYLLVAVAAGLLLVTLDNSVLFTALPTLTAQLGATPSQGLWIINAYPLVMAGLLLGAGTLGDRIGHRRMFLAGLVVFGAASLWAAFAPSANALIAARAVLAVGAAAMMPSTLALIRLAFDDERERNLAIAVWGSLALVGSALGPIIGGLLLERFWWGSVFLVNVPVAVFAFAAALAFAPHGERDASRPWDGVSSLLALAALSGGVAAIKAMAGAPPAWGQALVLATVAVVATLAFLRRQARLPYPLLDVAIFRHPALLSGVLSAAVSLFAIAGLQLATTQRYQLAAGFSPLEAGWLVSAVAFGALPSALAGGAVLHRTGLRPLLAGGLGVSALGVAIIAAGFAHGLGWVIAGLALTGIGVGASVSVASTAIIGNVPPHRAGMASSVEEVSYEFGGLLAVALLGSLASALYAWRVVLPAGVPDAARASFADAMAFARDAGLPAVADAATSAYDHAYVAVLAVIAAVLAAGAFATGRLLRTPTPITPLPEPACPR